ncbi:multidrug resistance protein 2 [Trichonephila clavipes]|uniref:Multidrug resistance protein 2 n=1 Tax=Trichonephila clavipes TaxID=2585209 RepID=A0A8X7BG67_TRICX|nr:multidrug resistance protein 2 [Trichonephila clavipes]
MFQDDVFEELVTYLTSMRTSFEKYFPEEQNTKMKLNSWIHNPFLPNLQKPESMSNEIYESLLEMSSDTKELFIKLRNHAENLEQLSVGYFSLFKYSGLWDKILMIIAILIASFSGMLWPIVCILSGQYLNHFVHHSRINMTEKLSSNFKMEAAGVECIQLVNKSDWNSWKENMKFLLMERGCCSFIEGTEPLLDETTATRRDKSEYKQQQDRALATIYYGIDEQYRTLVSSTTSPSKAWIILKEQFEPVSRASVIRLLDEFFFIKFNSDTESIAVFIARIWKMVERLKNVRHPLNDTYCAFQAIGTLSPEFQGIVQILYRWPDKDFKLDRIEIELIAEENRLKHDLNKIEDGIGEKVGFCISFLSSAIFCLACALYYGWKLSLVMLSITPIMALAMALISRAQAALSYEESKTYGAAGAVVEEALSSIRTVMAFGGELKEIQRILEEEEIGLYAACFKNHRISVVRCRTSSRRLIPSIFQLIRYHKRAERFLNNKVVNIRIDNGLEFIHKEFCKFFDSQGIEMERTNTYSPEMNGLRNKLNMKAKKGMVGYAMQTKGYRVWIPEEEKVIKTCNVSFNESVNGEAVLGLNNKSEYTPLITKESESDEYESETEISEDEIPCENLTKAVPRPDGTRVDIYYGFRGRFLRLRSYLDVEKYC